MKELLDILETADRLKNDKTVYALATVVKIGGSTYRRPGARMLIEPDGRRWGTISGGCLEGEVAEQALQVLASGERRVAPFELGDDDIVLGFGTGCDGVVHILIEPVSFEDDPNVLDLISACMQARRLGVMATVIDASGEFGGSLGRHHLLDETGRLSGKLGEPALRHDTLVAMKRLLELERSTTKPYLWHTLNVEKPGGAAEILLEVIRPVIRLVIFGEGHDVTPVVSAARQMAWTVEIIGRKPVEFLSNRFPEAQEHRFLMHPEDLGRTFTPDTFTAALVMSHTYVRDRDVMAELLKMPIPYVGMLGPRERVGRMIKEIRRQGRSLGDEELQRLFGPVGLDIGTETPEEIALSVVAEIQAVMKGRTGGHLRRRTDSIHGERAAMESEVGG